MADWSLPFSPLAYSGDTFAPGFDPSHVASKGVVRLSAVSSNGGFLNLINGKRGSGTPSYALTSAGPSTVDPSFSFSGNPTVVDADFTIAGIVDYKDISGAYSQILFGNSSNVATGGIAVYLGGGYISITVSNGVGNTHASPNLISCASWGPTLVGITRKGGPSNGSFTTAFFKPLNPTFGGLRISTPWADAAYAQATPDGTYLIGSGTTAGLPTYFMSVMYSNSGLLPSEIAQWAQDPWAFWYPRPAADLFMPFVPAAAGAADVLYPQIWM